MNYTLRPAAASEAKPLIGFYAESGAGKTYSALLTACGFVGGDMSDEDFAALNGDISAPEEGMSSDPVDMPQQAQDAAPAADAPVDQTTPAPAPQAEPEPKMVDIRALQEARAAERAAREELRKKDEEFARADERMRLLQQAWEQEKKTPVEAPKVPTMDDDPIGFYNHKIETLEQRLARFDEIEQQRVQAAEAEKQYQGLMGKATMQLNQAAAANPQVNEALQFAFEGLKQEIGRRLAPYNFPPDRQQFEATRMWRESMARMAQQLPADPNAAAEFVFSNARYYGYGYQQPQQQAEPVQIAQATPAQAAQQVQQPTVQQRQEQQNRHMSLSGVTGAEPPKKLDAKAISALSEKEFTALLKTVEGRKVLEQEFGGY